MAKEASVLCEGGFQAIVLDSNIYHRYEFEFLFWQTRIDDRV